MANKSKSKVKDELTALSVNWKTDNYQELCQLLKDATEFDGIIQRTDGTTYGISFALHMRAKKIGLTDDQLKAYPDAGAVLAALNRMSPASNPDARVKAVVPPVAKPAADNGSMPDKFEFESKMECGFIMGNRSQFDEQNLRAELRRLNRRYGACEPVRIDSSKSMKPTKGKNKDHRNCRFLVTTYEIFMK